SNILRFFPILIAMQPGVRHWSAAIRAPFRAPGERARVLMALVLLGINHNTANVEFREQVAFPPEKVIDAIGRARDLDGVEELVIVSTCNRTELYVEVDVDADGDPNLPSADMTAGA